MRTNIEHKNQQLAEKDIRLKDLEQEKETLAREKEEMKEASKCTQQKIEHLLLEKTILEKKLELSMVKSELLRLENSDINTITEQLADYSEQLESVKQNLEAEKKKISPLEEELQKKTRDLEAKEKKIKSLMEERESANHQLEIERERAVKESKALAISYSLTQPEDICHLLLRIAEAPENRNMKVKVQKHGYTRIALEALAVGVAAGAGGLTISVVAGAVAGILCGVLGAAFATCVSADTKSDLKTFPELLQGASQEDCQKIAKIAEAAAYQESIPLTFQLIIPQVTANARKLLIEVRKTLEY